jgi:NAD kinase
VVEYAPPLRMTVKRSEKPLKLLRNPALSYFDILRTKLFWGLDYRQMKNNNEGESE